jgi:hypothetical protein
MKCEFGFYALRARPDSARFMDSMSGCERKVGGAAAGNGSQPTQAKRLNLECVSLIVRRKAL